MSFRILFWDCFSFALLCRNLISKSELVNCSGKVSVCSLCEDLESSCKRNDSTRMRLLTHKALWGIHTKENICFYESVCLFLCMMCDRNMCLSVCVSLCVCKCMCASVCVGVWDFVCVSNCLSEFFSLYADSSRVAGFSETTLAWVWMMIYR